MEARLTLVRTNLLELHRVLIELERDMLQREQGPIAPGAFLQLLLEDPRFTWLRPMSALIVEIDEAVAQARKAKTVLSPEIAQPLIGRVMMLLSQLEGDHDFSARYLELMRQSPTVVTLHKSIVDHDK